MPIRQPVWSGSPLSSARCAQRPHSAHRGEASAPRAREGIKNPDRTQLQRRGSCDLIFQKSGHRNFGRIRRSVPNGSKTVLLGPVADHISLQVAQLRPGANSRQDLPTPARRRLRCQSLRCRPNKSAIDVGPQYVRDFCHQASADPAAIIQPDRASVPSGVIPTAGCGPQRPVNHGEGAPSRRALAKSLSASIKKVMSLCG
jgi:hypothetical protein